MKTDNLKIAPRWEKTKEEIWNERFAGLEEKSAPRKRRLLRSRKIGVYAAAAVLAVGLILPSIGYFYSRTVYAPKGGHLTCELPDGSTVRLNADTRLSYNPLWWKVSRRVTLDGEACFEVARGSTFTVRSGDASVTVLGTSFNVYARPNGYRVTCLTGRVEVTKSGRSVILAPGMQAIFEHQELVTLEIPDTGVETGWLRDHFIFNSVPLKQVIEEIERQYNIRVVGNDLKQEYIYTGNFFRTDDPADVLEIIGKPFGLELTFDKTD